MKDYTIVKFTGIDKGFSIPSILFEFTDPFFGIEISVRWYGVIIAFGFALAVLFCGRIAKQWKMDLDKLADVLIYGTLGGILGARLYYVAFSWNEYKNNLGDIIKFWEGGIAIYGGIIGAMIATVIVCKVRKFNLPNMLDLGAIGLLIGQGIGRWGNFTNQEAFGTNTDLPWGMTSAKIASYIRIHQQEFAANGFTVDPDLPVHPTFLYESIWCLLGVAVLYYILKKHRKFSGQLILTYGIWYGLGRVVIEGMRTDSLYIGNTMIRVSQLLSGVLVVACATALVILLIRAKKHPKPIEGVDFFPEEENHDEAEKEKLEKFKARTKEKARIEKLKNKAKQQENPTEPTQEETNEQEE